MKNYHFKKVCIMLMLLAALCLMSFPASAQNEQADHVNILFIIDDSGSMDGNDPGNLRYTAVKLFISALDGNDRVGAIRFSTDSHWITSGIVKIETEAKKVDMMNALQPVKANGYTDMKAAFEKAGELMSAGETVDGELIVVFLTDGKPEIPNPYATYEDEALAAAMQLGAPVYAIALTPQGQTAFLNQVARQTGGKVISAKNATDLLDSYLQILGDLKDRTVMGSGSVRAPADTRITLHPALMPYVSKVTFIASHEGPARLRLFSPDQTEIKPEDPLLAFSMTSDPGFSVFTIADPAGGDWTFRSSGSGNVQVRAILHSRLRARITSPDGTVEAGKPVHMILNLVEEKGDGSIVKIVGDATFTAIVTLPDGTQHSLDTFYDDGSLGDAMAGDGNFTRQFVDTSLPGTYRVTVQGQKGIVPVSASMNFEAIPFPVMVIDQPAETRYEIRSNPVPLKMHITETDAFEFVGSFRAVIEAPSGVKYDIPLSLQENHYEADFLPEENGSYRVQYGTDDAFFAGLPYRKEVQTEFFSALIYQVRLQSVRLGMDQVVEQTKYEVLQAIDGIPVTITIQSNSPKEETVIPVVEHLPGFTLIPAEPITIPPHGEITKTLRLAADQGLQPGHWDGVFTLYSHGAVDISNRRLPVKIEVFTPEVSVVISNVASQCSEGKCWIWEPLRFLLRTESSSLQTETLDILLKGTPESYLSRETLEIPPGSGEIELFLYPANRFSPGDYSGSILFTSARQGLEVSQPSLAFFFTVDPLWISCRKPLIISGIALPVLFIIGVVTIRNVRERRKSPIVKGTLEYWHQERTNEVVLVDLTGLNQIKVQIGRDPNNQIVIDDESLDDLHAVITSERVDDEIRQILTPQGPIVQRYQVRKEPIRLEEGTTFMMGSYIFKYMPDFEL